MSSANDTYHASVAAAGVQQQADRASAQAAYQAAVSVAQMQNSWSPGNSNNEATYQAKLATAVAKPERGACNG
jgi:hypothetical protein